MQVERSIKVRILDRDFPLRVGEEDSESTRQIAAYLNDRIEAFRRAHPEQPELTSAIIAALAVTEELFQLRERHLTTGENIEDEVRSLNKMLADALRSQ